MERISSNEEKTRVIMAAASILASCARNSPDNLTIYQIINRILILLQEPVFLLVYANEEQYSENNLPAKRLLFSTVENNPIFCHNYNEILHRFHVTHDGIHYLRKDYENKAILTENCKGLAFLIFSRMVYDEKISPKKSTDHNQQQRPNCIVRRLEHLMVKTELKDKNQSTCKMFKKLWQEIELSPYSSEMGYSTELSNLFINYMKADTEILPDSDNKETIKKSYFNYFDPILEKKQLKKIDGVVDQIYRMIDDTPILSPHGKFPPNILFFHRYYKNNNRKRFYDHFDYDIRLLFPKTQRKHLMTALNYVNQSLTKQTNEQNWNYDVISTHNRETSEREFSIGDDTIKKWNYPNKKIHKKFVTYLNNVLKKPDEEKLFFDKLSCAFSKDCMSLADPTMSTGFITLTQTPFDAHTGGLERLKRNNDHDFDLDKVFADNSELDSCPDLNRIVSLYFISATMATNCLQENKQSNAYKILNVPIRVAGAQFLNFSFLLNDNDDTQIFWEKSFRFFNDIVSQHIKRLRRALRETYAKEIEKLIKLFVKNSHKKRQYLTDRLNEQLLFLCRFWPYECLQIKDITTRYNSDTTAPCYTVEIDKEMYVNFTLSNNPFYKREPGSAKVKYYFNCLVAKETIQRAFKL